MSEKHWFVHFADDKRAMIRKQGNDLSIQFYTYNKSKQTLEPTTPHELRILRIINSRKKAKTKIKKGYSIEYISQTAHREEPEIYGGDVTTPINIIYEEISSKEQKELIAFTKKGPVLVLTGVKYLYDAAA